jgi:hypothetical protein
MFSNPGGMAPPMLFRRAERTGLLMTRKAIREGGIHLRQVPSNCWCMLRKPALQFNRERKRALR